MKTGLSKELLSALERIDAHDYLYLRDIREPSTNVLRLVVEEARASGEIRDLKIGDTVISGGRPIVSTSDCYAYEMEFENYVAYSVTNESYTIMDRTEEFVGRLFRVYTKSHFMDHLRVATIASEDYPGAYVHYGINCLDHIVDVAAVGEPNIRVTRVGKGEAI